MLFAGCAAEGLRLQIAANLQAADGHLVVAVELNADIEVVKRAPALVVPRAAGIEIDVDNGLRLRAVVDRLALTDHAHTRTEIVGEVRRVACRTGRTDCPEPATRDRTRSG